MPKFHVDISFTKTEVYEVIADTAELAEEHVFIDGKMIRSEEEAVTHTGTRQVPEAIDEEMAEATRRKARKV